MTVYSFQHSDSLKSLIKQGFLTAKESEVLCNRPHWHFLKVPYNWLKKQLAKRIENHSGDWPIWAWLSCPPHNLDASKRYGDNQVLIKARVPLGRCVISDFDMWEMAMNNWLIPDSITQAKSDINDKLKPTQKQKEKSWLKIFDLSKPTKKYKAVNLYLRGDDIMQGRYLQVCIDRIYLDEIQYIRPYSKTAKIPKQIKSLVREKS